MMTAYLVQQMPYQICQANHAFLLVCYTQLSAHLEEDCEEYYMECSNATCTFKVCVTCTALLYTDKRIVKTFNEQYYMFWQGKI